MSLFSFLVVGVLLIFVALLLFWFGFGMLHGTFQRTGRAFGAGATLDDLKQMEDRLHAALAANHS